MSTSKELVVNVIKHQGDDLLNVHKFHYNICFQLSESAGIN